MKVLLNCGRTLFFVWLALASVLAVPVTAASGDEFQYDSIKTPPGELVQFERYRMHVHCVGEGDTTVLFEPGLGGSALEWIPIQEKVSKRAHSYGGIIVRELAQLQGVSVAAMVLLDTSHEDQFTRLESSGSKNLLPTGTNFVISPIDAPENLPEDIKRQIKAFSRMRKTYSATHAEMAQFRQSAVQLKSTRTTVDYPITVVSRGLDVFKNTDQSIDRNAVWQELQQDLVSLSTDGRFIKAHNSGHHIHSDDPALVVSILDGLIDEIEAAR